MSSLENLFATGGSLVLEHPSLAQRAIDAARLLRRWGEVVQQKVGGATVVYVYHKQSDLRRDTVELNEIRSMAEESRLWFCCRSAGEMVHTTGSNLILVSKSPVVLKLGFPALLLTEYAAWLYKGNRMQWNRVTGVYDVCTDAAQFEVSLKENAAFCWYSFMFGIAVAVGTLAFSIIHSLRQ